MEKKRRVLVVDDQIEVANALKMALRMDGIEAQIATSGREALALFEPKKFDLVFTDFEMPEMNGHEFASLIKARDAAQRIIMVTAYADSVLTHESLPQVDLILGKPWSIEELREAVKKILPA